MDLMDDDELFAVIGHELGHVVNKDSMKAMKRAYLGSAAREAIYAAGGYGQLAGTILGDISEA
jgi:putative metalloprotease